MSLVLYKHDVTRPSGILFSTLASPPSPAAHIYVGTNDVNPFAGNDSIKLFIRRRTFINFHSCVTGNEFADLITKNKLIKPNVEHQPTA